MGAIFSHDDLDPQHVLNLMNETGFNRTQLHRLYIRFNHLDKKKNGYLMEEDMHRIHRLENNPLEKKSSRHFLYRLKKNVTWLLCNPGKSDVLSNWILINLSVPLPCFDLSINAVQKTPKLPILSKTRSGFSSICLKVTMKGMFIKKKCMTCWN